MALVGLGRIAMAEDDVDEARKHLERARDLNPEVGSVRALLARLYRRTGDAEKAAEEASHASLAKDSVGIEDPIHFRMTQESVASTAQLRRARAAEEASDYVGAEKIYRELAALRPEDADIRAGLGDALARQNKREEAKEHYHATLALKPDHAGALYGLGTVLSVEGKYDEAMGLYEKSLEQRPDHVPSITNLASLRAFRGDSSEALALYRKALELEPESIPAHRGLADLYFRERNYQEAAPYYRKVLEAKPDEGALHLKLAVCLAMTGNPREASSRLLRARDLGETIPPELLSEVERQISLGKP
jgi:tetratricopeptide (TPR) repeat protein